jgi:DNA-binding transcriptional LysR family regulator
VSEGFECAVRVGYLSDSNLIARRIGPIRGRLVASPAYIKEQGEPKAPEDILRHQALLQGTEAWHFIDGDKKVTIHPQGRFKADNGGALATAAIAGLGIAALPDFLTEAALASGALVSVMTRYPLPEAGIFLVRPPGRHPPRKVRVFTDLLVEHFGG